MSLQIAHVLDSISRSGRCGPLPIASGNNAAPAREAQAEVTRRKDKQGTLPCGIVPTMFGRIDSFGMDVGWAGGGGGLKAGRSGARAFGLRRCVRTNAKANLVANLSE